MPNDTALPSIVCFGEILWDILPDRRMPGGAPMNVAYHLNTLGLPAQLVSRVGPDGGELLDFIGSKQVSTQFVQHDDVHETGRVLATVTNNDVTYEIIEPVAWDFIQPGVEVESLVTRSDYFVFGSLAARSEVSRSTLYQLLELAPQKVLDINLRAPHYERSVLEYLLRHADVLKLNHHEIDLLSGWYGYDGGMRECVQQLKQDFQLGTVVVTRGANGALVYHGDRFYEHEGFPVEVVDTIGSGDSFLAAFLSKMTRGYDIDQALEFACALGAFVATREGACPEYTMEEVEAIKNRSSVAG